MRRLLTLPLVFLVRLYQWTVAPALPPSCRYVPSCSQYMIDALVEHGPLRGGWMGFCRILRCHPWGSSGFDPVPSIPAERESAAE